MDQEERILRLLSKVELSSNDLEYINHLIQKGRELAWKALIKKAFFHKVPSLVLNRLTQLQLERCDLVPEDAIESIWKAEGIRDKLLNIYHETPDSLHPLFRLAKTLDEFRNRRIEALSAMLKGLYKNGMQALVFKGIAIEPLYPPTALRDLADVDILVPDFEGGWKVAQSLMGIGYEFKRLYLIRRKNPLVYEIHGANSHGVHIDLHFQIFRMQCISAIEAPFWERAVRTSLLSGILGMVPSREDSLLILLAHMCHHGYMLLRDINDAYILLTHDPKNIDWDYVTHTADQNELSGLLWHIIQEVEGLYDVTPILPVHCNNHNRFSSWPAKILCQRGRPGRMYQSLPYLTLQVLKLENKRYGLTIALRDVFGLASVMLERDLLYGSKQTWIRSLILWFIRILFRRNWIPSHVRSWYHMALHNVRIIVNGIEQPISNINTTAFMEASKVYNTTITPVKGVFFWKSSNGLEFIITPIGVFFSFRWTSGPISEMEDRVYNTSYLECQVGKIIKKLTSHGLIEVRAKN